MILDAGFLVAVDCGDRDAHVLLTAAVRSGTALHTTHPVVAQVWRDGARQARLSAFLDTVTVHPFDDGRPVGRLLARSNTRDVTSAHLVACVVRLGHDILTADPGGAARRRQGWEVGQHGVGRLWFSERARAAPHAGRSPTG